MSGSDYLQPLQFLELHHGTNTDIANSIRDKGMTSEYYTKGNPTLTSDADEAGKYANAPAYNRGKPPAVVTVRVPHHQVGDYLHEPDATAHEFTGTTYGLKQPLPPSFIHNVNEL